MFYKYIQLTLLFAIILLQVSAQEFDSKRYARESLKNNCKEKWGTNYEMVKYCIKNQITAYKNVKRQSSSTITNTPSNSIITNNCKKKWETNYEMIEYCIKNQTTAYKNVKNKNNGTLTQLCKKKWGTNYEMVEYCIKNKEAANSYINNKSSFGDSSFVNEVHKNKFGGSKFDTRNKFRSR